MERSEITATHRLPQARTRTQDDASYWMFMIVTPITFAALIITMIAMGD